MRRSLRVLLGSLLGLLLLAPGLHAREVRVGVYPNEPKIYMNAEGRAAGIFIDLFEAMAAESGWTPRYVPCQWQECLQALDLVHASYFGREIDLGMVNHAARLSLGDAIGRLGLPGPGARDPALREGDWTHRSSVRGRRYIWRQAVTRFDELAPSTLEPAKIARLEAELDEYLPPSHFWP